AGHAGEVLRGQPHRSGGQHAGDAAQRARYRRQRQSGGERHGDLGPGLGRRLGESDVVADGRERPRHHNPDARAHAGDPDDHRRCHGSPVSVTAFSIAGPVNGAQTTLVASPATITASSGTSASTITVTARDQYGNPVRGKTVTLTATGSANALVQPRDTTDPNGVATGSLSSTFAEAKVLSATVPGISITQRDTVTVSPAAATHLAFLVGPSNVAAGTAITPPIQVEVRDQFNNRVTAASPGVSLGFGNEAGGGDGEQ